MRQLSHGGAVAGGARILSPGQPLRLLSLRSQNDGGEGFVKDAIIFDGLIKDIINHQVD